jgi:hypothetical protein
MARTLEPWVSGGSSKSPHYQRDYSHSSHLADPSEPTYSQYFPMSRSTVTPQTSRTHGVYAAPIQGPSTSTSGRKTPVTKTKGDGPDEHFAAHCRSFSAHVNVSLLYTFYA